MMSFPSNPKDTLSLEGFEYILDHCSSTTSLRFCTPARRYERPVSKVRWEWCYEHGRDNYGLTWWAEAA